MKQLIRKRFPQVAQLSTAELAEWLQTKSRAQPVLLDVRTAEEFRVSHLRGGVAAFIVWQRAGHMGSGWGVSNTPNQNHT